MRKKLQENRKLDSSCLKSKIIHSLEHRGDVFIEGIIDDLCLCFKIMLKNSLHELLGKIFN